MSIFTLKEGKVQIEPQNLTIPEFREIYERDKSKDKTMAFNELCYVYHMADYKSVYHNYEDWEKQAKILADYFKGSYWKPDDLVEKAIDRYRSLQETPSMRLAKAGKKAINKVIKYLEDVDLTERDAKGAIVNKITDITNSVGGIGKMVESLDKVEEKIKKEQMTTTKIRGQADITEYERQAK